MGIAANTLYANFRTSLIALADDDFCEFSMCGIPCERPFLGVRIPEIRKLVAQIPREHFAEMLAAQPIALEEVIARGFMIARLPYAEMLEQFDSQIKLLDNWCTVDTFCAALGKIIRGHEEQFLDLKVGPLLKRRDEFAVRAGLVLLIDFYVKFEYLALIFDRIESLREREEYYIKMDIAWLVAECFIKFPEATRAYLEISKLEKWTFNKAIAKICDSTRVDKETKAELKELRRKQK